MSLRKKITAIVILMLTIVCMPALAQDLLAKQAPVDRRMRAVDTLALRNIIAKEEFENPSSALYDSWDNTVANTTATLPDSFRINLRHFAMPTTSRIITSKMGPRWGRQHKGIDVKVYIGDTIRAAFSGKVRIVKYEGSGYGKYVVIRHPNGLETVYAHMSAWLVSRNQNVKAGQPIGLGGNTGRSTGSHLHFETRLCGVALNPALLFDFVNQDVTGDSYTFRRSVYERENRNVNRSVITYANKVKDLKSTSRENYADDEEDMVDEVPAVAPANEAARNDAPVRFHKVSVGETLTSIAKRRGLSVAELCKLNRLDKNTKVRPGQLLRYT